MPNNTSVLSYDGLRRTCDRALAADTGIVVTTESRGRALNFRSRFYKMREADRRDSRGIYPEGDPRYGASVYDTLVILIEGEKVKILKEAADYLQIEEIA